MRPIKYIAVHCTATAQTATVENIQKYWREVLGWQQPGYHFIIKPNGEIAHLLDIEKVSNGVKGFNSETINISYIGGVDANNNPKDTRTFQQKVILLSILNELKKKFPNAIIQGHKDFPNVHKACPSFEAKTEYKNI
jgi:N-acetylmuramoyl-L-alanine amidase